MSTPLEQFQQLKSTHEFIFLIFYRGSWCPFCISWLKDLQLISSEIAAQGGVTIAVTAESSDKLPEAQKNSGYVGDTIVDPGNSLAAAFKTLNVAITPKGGYPHGMAQPAVLVMKKDGTFLYRWAIVPSVMNLKGALDRPSLLEIWEDAQSQLKNGTAENKDKTYSTSRQSFKNVVKAKVFG